MVEKVLVGIVSRGGLYCDVVLCCELDEVKLKCGVDSG